MTDNQDDRPGSDPDSGNVTPPNGLTTPDTTPLRDLQRPAGVEAQRGEVLCGRYTKEEFLGRGAFGCVWKCHDRVAGIYVAIKQLPPEVARNTAQVEAIRSNFQGVECLHHPHIAAAKTLEVDAQANEYYLVMEYVDGIELNRLLRERGGRLPLEEVLRIASQVALALDYCHDHNIVHRDVKPGNIMVDARRNVKVLDFGIATEFEPTMSGVEEVGAPGSRFTCGTWCFMPPEQWKGLRLDGRTDQYALAATMYKLLCGRAPFEDAPNQQALMAAIEKEPVPRIEGLDETVWSALERALAKDRKARFDTCNDFLDACKGRVVPNARATVSPGWIAACAGCLVFAAATLLIAGRARVLPSRPPLEDDPPRGNDTLQASTYGDLASSLAGYADEAAKKVRQDRLLEMIGYLKANPPKLTPGDQAALAEYAQPRIVAVYGPVDQSRSQEGRYAEIVWRNELVRLLGDYEDMTVVGRTELAEILGEVALGTVDTSDDRARSQVGKLLPASLVVSGECFIEGSISRVYLRLLEVDSSVVLKSFEAQVKHPQELAGEVQRIREEIHTAALAARPLLARVKDAGSSPLQAYVGSFHGAREDTTFELVRRVHQDGFRYEEFLEERIGTAGVKTLRENTVDLEPEWEGSPPDAGKDDLWVREIMVSAKGDGRIRQEY